MSYHPLSKFLKGLIINESAGELCPLQWAPFVAKSPPSGQLAGPEKCVTLQTSPFFFISPLLSLHTPSLCWVSLHQDLPLSYGELLSQVEE